MSVPKPKRKRLVQRGRRQTGIDVLTAGQVAELCGVTVRAVSKWNAEGRLVAVHKNPGRTGALLFDAREVMAFKEARDEA